MDWIIKTPVELDFNPLEESTRKELREVFENKLARTLWMGIKQKGYLVNPDFEKDCLNTSEIFEKLGVPDTTDKLKRILERQFTTIYQQEFLEDLLPYLSGKKDLEYQVLDD
jgi:hypothetical protein